MKQTIICLALLTGLAVNASAKQLIPVDKALKKIYPKAERFEKNVIRLDEQQIRAFEESADIIFEQSHSPLVFLYEVYGQNGERAGTAFEDTVVGKWGPIHYLVGLNNDGTILKVMVLDYFEIRGKPVAKRRFTKQYRGKTIDDPIRLRDDIDGVTGATISSRSMTDGVRKLVHYFQSFNK